MSEFVSYELDRCVDTSNDRTNVRTKMKLGDGKMWHLHNISKKAELTQRESTGKIIFY